MASLNTKKLHSYADGELSKSEAQEVKRRLEADPETQRSVQEVERLGGLVKRYLQQQVEEFPPKDVWAAVSKRLEEEPLPGLWARLRDRLSLAPRKALWPVWAAGAAAAVVLVALWVFVWGPSPDADTAPKGPGGGSNRLVVESMEYGGPPPMLFQIEDQEGEGTTTVIWVNPVAEEDDSEEPHKGEPSGDSI
jgi:anti-sigma factor RsiW